MIPGIARVVFGLILLAVGVVSGPSSSSNASGATSSPAQGNVDQVSSTPTPTATPAPTHIPRPTAAPTVSPVFSVIGAKINYGNSDPVRARSRPSLSSVQVHQTVKLILDVKLSGISGPTRAYVDLRVRSGASTLYVRQQVFAVSSSMNGIQSYWTYWTATTSGFDQLFGAFSFGAREESAISPLFSVTTCQSPTVHGIECLGRGPFSQFASQGPDTPAKRASPVAVPSCKLLLRLNLVTPYCRADVRFVPSMRNVQHNPTITVVFWGAQWHRYPGIVAQLLSFYSRLRGSAYNAALSQYNNAANNPTLIGAWLDPAPPRKPNGWRASAVWPSLEVERIRNLTGLNLNPSSQVIVVLPPGFSIGPDVTSLAHHGVVQTEAEWESNMTVARHGLVSYLLWAPHASVATAGVDFTEFAAHEWAEAVTNPGPRLGFLEPYRGEVADICELAGPITSRGLTLARFYSPKAKACVAPSLGPKAPG
jgi:hypothetical protein